MQVDGGAPGSAAQQGKASAPAASQEDVTGGVIAIMNIGGGDPKSFTSPGKIVEFGKKLDKDIMWMIRNGADIIMLQEVSEHWAEYSRRSLSKDWSSWYESEAGNLMTLYNKKKVQEQSRMILHVWPEAERDSHYRRWRTFTVVRRGAADPHGPRAQARSRPLFLDLVRVRTPPGRRSLGPGVGNG